MVGGLDSALGGGGGGGGGGVLCVLCCVSENLRWL